MVNITNDGDHFSFKILKNDIMKNIVIIINLYAFTASCQW